MLFWIVKSHVRIHSSFPQVALFLPPCCTTVFGSLPVLTRLIVFSISFLPWQPFFGGSTSINQISGKIKSGEEVLASLDGHWVTYDNRSCWHFKCRGSGVCGRTGSPWQAPCLGAEAVEGQRILPPCVIPKSVGMLELSRPHLSRSRMLPQSHPPAAQVTLALPEPGPKPGPVRSVSIETSGSVFRVPGLGQAPMAVD